MRVIFIPLLVVVLPILGAAVGAALHRLRNPAPALEPGTAEYRLLQRSARVLDRIVNDEMVGPMLPEAAKAEAQSIIDDFYRG